MPTPTSRSRHRAHRLVLAQFRHGRAPPLAHDAPSRQFDLPALLTDPGVRPIVLTHARRGLTLQLTLRAVLVVFVIATLTLLPPGVGALASGVIAAVYALTALVLGVWLWRGGRAALR